MKTFLRFVFLMLGLILLAGIYQSAQASTYYLLCRAQYADGVQCPVSSYGWQETGVVPPAGTWIVDQPTSSWQGWAFVFYRASSFRGTVTYAAVCLTNPGNGFNCPSWAVPTYQSMLVQDAIPTCIPSPRTIDPCPSGYAPGTVSGLSSEVGDAYSSAYEKLPLQDMVYASLVAVCGLLGVAVGTRLS